jgi:uronate dehydrogenase
MSAASSSRINRLLITGAAGALGRVLRDKLKADAAIRRLSDRAPMAAAAADEEVVACDLADKAAVQALLKDVDAVVHLGGVSVEGPFEPILQSNIVGIYNLYEAARRNGVRRVVFASSNHAVGFHLQSETIDADDPTRPDGYYGISKCFGESLSRFYFDRYGIETVCMRIGSSFPEPMDRRMLTTWLSYDDLAELVRRALFTPGVGHTIVFGTSNNRDSFWDNSKAAHLGWTPRDSAEPWRAKVEAAPPLETGDPLMIYQGGRYTAMGPYDN